MNQFSSCFISGTFRRRLIIHQALQPLENRTNKPGIFHLLINTLQIILLQQYYEKLILFLRSNIRCQTTFVYPETPEIKY